MLSVSVAQCSLLCSALRGAKEIPFAKLRTLESCQREFGENPDALREWPSYGWFRTRTGSLCEYPHYTHTLTAEAGAATTYLIFGSR